MIRISITAKITGLVLGCVILSIATANQSRQQFSSSLPTLSDGGLFNDFNNLFMLSKKNS